MTSGAVADLEVLLVLVAFRHGIREPDFEHGLRRFAEIIERSVDPEAFAAAVSYALADRDIEDPVRLPEGSLQCHWHLRPTHKGVSKVATWLQMYGVSADELIVRLGTR